MGLEQNGVPNLDVLIVLNEVPADNWAVGGAIPASDVELGFRIDI
jgi:phenylpyruvate tautomerase PptA (4-oxalocrotonate tautomerase family)